MTAPPSPSPASMRGRIKDLTTRLLIKNGYQGFRFRDVAAPLQSTRANIHYYFGNKEKLVNEVVCEYMAATIARMAEGWNDPDKSLKDKIRWMMESNRQRYLQSNPTGQTAHPWSLIARMRLERDHIGEEARKATLGFSEDLERLVRNGIMAAIAKGELRPETPVDDVTLQLVAIANSADPITQDDGSFDRLEQLYLAFARIIAHAYGHKPAI
jgi:TetR/AcrR family transcriptional regulator, transcriptional repressor for nem operon